MILVGEQGGEQVRNDFDGDGTGSGFL